MILNLNVISVIDLPSECCDIKCDSLFDRNNLISIFSNKSTIKIWNPEESGTHETFLVKHHGAITSLALSHEDHKYLCSSSSDMVVIWDLHPLRAADRVGVIVGVDLGPVEHCCFSWHTLWLALCTEAEILIIKLIFQVFPSYQLEAVERQACLFTAAHGKLCCFSPQDVDLLVVVEDGNCFKVWNVSADLILYRSSSLGTHTITCCTFGLAGNFMAVGTNRGSAHAFTVTEERACCCFTVDIHKQFYQESVEDATGVLWPNDRGDQDDVSRQVGCVVSCVQMCPSSFTTDTATEEQAPGFSISEDVFKSILHPAPVLVACCNLGVALFDLKSWDCLARLSVPDMVPCWGLRDVSLALVSVTALSCDSLHDIRCVLKAPFSQRRQGVIRLRVMKNSGILDAPSRTVAVESVNFKSPLRLQLGCVKSSSNLYLPKGKSNFQPKKPMQIKSSGYGSAPITERFQPVINNRHRIQKTSKSRRGTSGLSLVLNEEDVIVGNCGPPATPRQNVSVWDTAGTTIQLATSGDGRQLAASSSMSQICVLKFADMDIQHGNFLIGHNGPINSLHFSHNFGWLVSASNDGTAKVWNWRQKRCMLNIDSTVVLTKASRMAQKSGLRQAVTAARFYYMDRFILLAAGGCLELYCHALDEFISGPNLRTQPVTLCKRIKKISTSAQQVTCLSAANSFHSYMVLTGCSNKRIQVYDFNVQQFVVEMADTHMRPPHCLRQLEGSQCMSHPAAMYDLFLSAAVCDGAKLWDLRTARCVQRFSQHTNRAYTCGVDISPCGRFVAASSEDRCVHLYDTRKCDSHLHKLAGLGDVVTDVVFNPMQPILAAAALNGHVATYNPVRV